MYCDSCGKPIPEVGISSTPPKGTACSFPGCTGTVVGTCAGYKIECRNPLCATHTKSSPSPEDRVDPLSSHLRPSATQTNAGLCPECAERKSADDTAETIYADYQQKAEWIMHSDDDWLKTAGVVIAVVDLLLFLLLRQTAAYKIFLLVAAVVGCMIGVVYYQNRKLNLAQTAERNPGFAEFYRAWRENKDLRHRDQADAGEMGEIALGVAANTVKARQPAQLRDDRP